ncbi:MAG: zinc-dependent metalloprotease [Flavobacteriaceae bacterium]
MKKQYIFVLGVFMMMGATSFSHQKKHLEYRKTKKKEKQWTAQNIINEQKFEGFFNFKYIESKDQLLLEVSQLDTEFLYVNSLSEGIGSNDIGLDRGQLGNRRIVKFQKAGNKLLLLQPNYTYRATTTNLLEKKSVTQAFAKSVLFGFPIEKEEAGAYWIDLTPFLKQDAHGVVKRLKDRKQGSYSLDKSRSALSLDRTKAFPKNIEMEVLLTFTGTPSGSWVRSVTPTPEAVTVHQHHSFIALPDPGFEKRKFDPRAGVNALRYYDYATPVESSTLQEWIVRHRLEKKDPNATVSEAKNPIVYYLDNGTPEPVRSALLEGGRWWNQAFEAIGYRNAFQIKMLPDEADPLDVRYNVIQWVHRSTRGWSYGASVVDPRTGEIIKGHVSLGSLRIRQDYMIALGLTEDPFQGGIPKPDILEMALARIRQLSAHEIGHTLGFAHNFSASAQKRASVMDYPHPTLSLKNGKISYADAYDTDIGEWDKVSVAYAYSDFADGIDTNQALNEILEKSTKEGLSFISDQDARPLGGAHPTAHLWDNGTDTTEELNNLMAIRKVALGHMGLPHLQEGESYNKLEDRLVPIFLLHRYQIEAVSKLIGGLEYQYAVKGNIDYTVQAVTSFKQKEALNAYLATLHPDQLLLPEKLRNVLPPRAYGSTRDRENFKGHMGVAFDHLNLAQSLAQLQMQLLFHPQRVNRLVQQKSFDSNQLGLTTVFDTVWKQFFNSATYQQPQLVVQQLVQYEVVKCLFVMYLEKNVYPQAKAATHRFLKKIETHGKRTKASNWDHYIAYQIESFWKHPQQFQSTPSKPLPDGSPIGSVYSCN